jgi:hypothetical protein
MWLVALHAAGLPAQCEQRLEENRLATIADAHELPLPRLPPLSHATCALWPTEVEGAISPLSASVRTNLVALAHEWLEPLRSSAVDFSEQPSGDVSSSGCARVLVRDGEVYLALPDDSLTGNLSQYIDFTGCGRPPQGESLATWNYALRARLLVLLRLLRIALSEPWSMTTSTRTPWPDFAVTPHRSMSRVALCTASVCTLRTDGTATVWDVLCCR